MKKSILYIKNKIVFLVAVTLAAVVGGATTAVVMAAIPDSNGQINACYKNNTQALRVTDPAGNCDGNETSISWSQNGGGIKAYARLVLDSSTGIFSLDSAHSSGIASFNQSPTSSGAYCLTVNFSPNILLSDAPSSLQNYSLKYSSGWDGSFSYTNECDSFPTANVAVWPTNAESFLAVN